MDKELHEEYERIHWADLIAIGVILERLFNRYVDRIFMRSSILRASPDGKLNLDQNPVFLRIMSRELDELFADIEITTKRAVRKEWSLSVQKNDKWMARLLAGKKIPERIREKLYKTNIMAVDGFIKRKHGGLNLSQRIWELKSQLQSEIEAGLQLGVAKGTPATTMAMQMKHYLKDSDRLFRRVRDELGQLQLSRAAKAYHPGPGKYRSSYKNALRLTRNEMNLAYRTADYERWQDMDFIGGFEVRLSNRHHIPDICDSAAGRYPKEFKFVGWHTSCLCNAIPITPNKEQFEDYMNALLDGREYQFQKPITDIPQGLRSWLDKNQDAINRMKSRPYFIADNFKGRNIDKGLAFK